MLVSGRDNGGSGRDNDSSGRDNDGSGRDNDGSAARIEECVSRNRLTANVYHSSSPLTGVPDTCTERHPKPSGQDNPLATSRNSA